jgi:Prokaryotic E2 family D
MHTTLSKWKLSFPYVVFILQTDVTSAGVVFTDNCKIFYRNSPILDQTDALCRVNTANVWDNHKICTGGSGGMRTTGNSLAEKAESYIAAFWQSQFNTDLLDHYHAAARKFPEVANLEAWQAKSAEDDTFPLRIEWDKVTTIAKIIKEIVES